MKRTSKLLLFILTISLLVCLTVFAASAETVGGKCGDNLTCSLDTETGVLTISGEGRMYDYDYDYSPWYGNKSHIKSVNIGDSVTSIGSSAFLDCSSLRSVTIPDSVTSIGSSVFYNTAIYNNSNNWTNNVLYIGNHLIEAKTDISGSYIIKDGTKTIADSAFCDCSSLTSVTIPDSVTSIGSSAFYNCWNLTSVTIPDSVTSIGNEAFIGCSSLTSVTIPDSVTSIGGSAFWGCSSLTSVTIPDNVTSIGWAAFYYCKSLASVTIPESVTSIGDEAFSYCSSLTSVTIPDSVTSIGYGAFYNCSNLTNVTIPDSVTSIGNWAFYGCDSISDVYYTGSVSDWYKISIGSDNSCLTGANIHYNYIYAHQTKDHTSDKGTVTKKATCTEKGEKTYKCTVCGEVIKTTSIAKLAHKEGILKAVTATAKKSGLTEGKKCSVCGKTLTAQKMTLAQVTGLKSSSEKTTSLKLTWTKIAGAKYYKVEQSTDGKKWTVISKAATTNSLTVKSLKAGTKYQFRVTALDSTKKISGKASAALKTGTLTAAPSVTVKSTKSKTAVASWKKVTGASKYIVYKSTDGKKWDKGTSTAKTTLTLSKLTGGKKIYVKAVAVNAYGKNSAASKAVSVTVKK